jgi:hypothetical protein
MEVETNPCDAVMYSFNWGWQSEFKFIENRNSGFWAREK